MARLTKKQREQRQDELRRMLRTAALTIDPDGRLSSVARKAGVSSKTLTDGMNAGGFKRGTALILEYTFGASILPKEKLAPEYFS